MSKRPLVGGLIAGFLTAILALIVIVAALPAPTARVAPSTSPGPSSSAVPSSTGVQVGAAAPALVLAQLGGGTIDLATLTGKPVWLSFFATTCVRCATDLSAVSSYAAKYVGTGLVVVAVDVGEDEAAVTPFVTNSALPLPVGLDTARTVATAWGVGTLPTYVWIDAQGIVRAVVAGSASKAEMATSLGTILPGVTVTP